MDQKDFDAYVAAGGTEFVLTKAGARYVNYLYSTSKIKINAGDRITRGAHFFRHESIKNSNISFTGLHEFRGGPWLYLDLSPQPKSEFISTNPDDVRVGDVVRLEFKVHSINTGHINLNLANCVSKDFMKRNFVGIVSREPEPEKYVPKWGDIILRPDYKMPWLCNDVIDKTAHFVPTDLSETKNHVGCCVTFEQASRWTYLGTIAPVIEGRKG